MQSVREKSKIVIYIIGCDKTFYYLNNIKNILGG